MKRRYFCQTQRADSLTVRSTENDDRMIFTTSKGIDVYLNSTQVSDLISLLQTWRCDRTKSPPLWEDQ